MSNYVDSILGPLKDIPSLETSSQPALRLIFDDAGINSAHRALVLSYNQGCRKKVLHGLTVQLLNLISASYYKHFLGGGDAVVFARRLSNNLPGDYLALDTPPDVYGFAGTFPDLLVASRSPNAVSPQPWSVLLEVGALKRPKDAGDAVGQLKFHLKGLKRYRPDLFTVCGFSLDTGNVRLAALNPGGLTSSDPIPMEALAPWVAHVAQVYSFFSHRDPDMQYCPHQERFCRWDVRKAGHGLAVTPFHVGHAPGRTTFACFEVGRLPDGGEYTSPAFVAELDNNYDVGVVKGFWKMSWQRTTTRGTEAELLTKLHKNGWVPGLVRYYPETTLRDCDNDGSTALHPSRDEDVGRVKDILHLGSIGQPLSQCGTVEELLDTMYDLIETHAHVCELGVCHRDVSYFNALCKPKHYLTIHPVLNKDRSLERPCIKKIFGDRDGQPCALLTDLDHATTFEDLVKEPLETAEIVGTRMFMSLDLAAPDAPRILEPQNLGPLLHGLTAAETTHPDLFRVAFPRGDGDFVERFKLFMADETVRANEARCDLPGPVPRAHHDPRHDAESIYWVFLYASARALPLGLRQEDVRETARYKQFCRAMLLDETGPLDLEELPTREAWMSACMHDGYLFAPPLRRLALLFRQMARYLCVPWHLYCGEGQPMADLRTHVHVAFRRLILAFKLDPDNADVLRVALDTAQPRYTSIFDDKLLNFAMPTDEGEDSERASSTRDTPAPCGQKRRAETQSATVSGEDKHASKKPRTSRLASADAVAQKDGGAAQHDAAALDVDPSPRNVDDGAIHANASTIDELNDVLLAVLAEPQVNAPVNRRKAPEPQPEERYDPALHRDSLSAKALRLMFLKDKELWFGRGKY